MKLIAYNIITENLEFEAWARKIEMPLDRDNPRSIAFRYISDVTEYAWRAWIYRAAHTV